MASQQADSWNSFIGRNYFVAFLLCVLQSAVIAAPGSLDTTFNGSGIVTTGVATGSGSYSDDLAYSVIQQQDGKLVVAGWRAGSSRAFALVRYNVNGSLDGGFNGTGIVTLDTPSFLREAHSVIQQADGKLVVFGKNEFSQFSFARLNTDGSLDATFGSGGVVTVALSGTAIGWSVIQQQDGKLLAVGQVYNGSWYDVGIIRLSTSGSLDTSFNGTGKREFSVGAGNDFPYALIQQQDGKIVIAGSADDTYYSDGFVTRLNLDGSTDATFGASGIAVTNIGKSYFNNGWKSLLQQGDGKLVVSGYGMEIGMSTAGFATARFDTNGLLDSTWAGDGIVVDGGDTDDVNTTMAQQSDGKIVVSGINSNHITVIRHLSDGSFDTSFGVNGAKNITIGTQDFATSMIQQMDGKLVVVGRTRINGYLDFFVARLFSGQDIDGDGYDDEVDAFPFDPSESLDSDGDGAGNNADTDDDGDNVADISDNCPLTSNADQLDTDNDHTGDACDGDDDNDGLVDAADNCPLLTNLDQLDTDNDGIGDACDSDDDNDNVADISDNCPLMSNADQLDTDNDHTGDACDGDDDNDGLVDATDNCPLLTNLDQLDTDNDDIGDVCDSDDDSDGVADISDAFPLDATESVDTDGDNLGDNSDPLPNDSSTLNNYLNGVAGDKTGASVAFAGDFNGDGYGDYVIGIPLFDIPAVPPAKAIKDAGRAVVISGKDGNQLAELNGTTAKAALGTAVAGGADIDGDTFDDAVIGAPNAGAAKVGSVTVLYGPNGSRTAVINGTEAKAQFGAALAMGDVDGDGNADVVVGAPKAANPMGAKPLVQAGSVSVYSGDDLNGDALLMVYGTTAKAYAGSAVAVGDFNGTGGTEVIVGAPNEDAFTNDVPSKKLADAGSVKIYTYGTVELIYTQYGAAAKDYFGKAVAAGADVNSDSVDDVLVGATGLDHPADKKLKDVGGVVVLSGSSNTSYSRSAPVLGSTPKSGFGSSVALGDVDHDTYADLIVGAPKDDKPTSNPNKPIKDAGSVTVYSGNGFAPVTTLYGDAAKDYFGSTVRAGDINSDDFVDLIIGIPNFDALAMKPIKDAGKVSVVSGAGL